MRLPLFGQRRLRISIRVDHVMPGPEDLAEAEQSRRVREQALAQRTHWEHEIVTQIGWLK